MATIASTYPYKPLPANHIRLLVIEPGEDDAELLCSLVVASLDGKCDYEALSYTWGSSIASNGFTDAEMNVEMVCAVYGKGKENEPVRNLRFREIIESADHANIYYDTRDPSRPRNVTIDGFEVDIGGELYHALLRIRAAEEPLKLWVDALCINQTDTAERTEQVRVMGAIYAGAKRVRIWLGEGLQSDAQAFETLVAAAEKMAALMEEGLPRDLQRLSFIVDKAMSSLHWDSLAHLLNREWFRRVWVIQEVANAVDALIHVGPFTYQWDYFATMVIQLRRLDVDLFMWSRGELTATDTVDMMHRLSCTSSPGKPFERPPLLEILRDSRSFRCTVPHDKIYGVLGLAADSSFVSVDYSLSASEVYKRLAVSYLEGRDPLDILYCCTKSQNQSQLNLPSWVPDWTQPCYHSPFRFMSYPSSAAGTTTPRFTVSPNINFLSIHGKAIDTIFAIDCIRPIPRNTKPFSKEGLPLFTSHHRAWADELGTQTQAWFSNIPKIAFPNSICTSSTYEDLWRAFTCNRTRDGEIPPADWSQQFADFLASCGLPPGKYAELLNDEEKALKYDLRETTSSTTREKSSFRKRWEGMTPYIQANGTWCYNRRFFRTEKGRFGWAPDGAREGDEICVFYGGDVPFVLRGKKEQEVYEIIGDAYLHGFMNGEALCSEIEDREFCLV